MDGGVKAHLTEAKDLFTAALQLGGEWRVVECDLRREVGLLSLRIDFTRGSKFMAPVASHQLGLPVHDTVKLSWQHLNFFRFRTELVARVPQLKTPDGQVL